MVDQRIELFVNGTLMRGLALHDNLAGAPLVAEATTVPAYRLYSVGDVHPAMVRDETAGAAIAGELYDLPLSTLAAVLDGEPAGLGIGVVELEGLGLRIGVLWVAGALPADAVEITAHGGWRAYRAAATAEARA
ncbi:allophanate hydrolase-related protein [Patulibacter defluvii]|uniref:allophanate hydrolase-related protein n=1 Tax=Patulibacter defluvii TaxID=3095358 RepID=UPI002A762451|nr:gamma-glutamylcyclotransferase [Patulibacter sp. DM4]